METKKIRFEVEVEMPSLYDVKVHPIDGVELSDEQRANPKETYTKDVEEEIERFIKKQFSKDVIQEKFENEEFLESELIEDWEDVEKDYNIKFDVKKLYNN